jgi:hypothetical protein
MDLIKTNGNSIIRIILFLNALLVITIFFLYRTITWPLGPEVSGCLFSFILLTITFILLWIKRNKLIHDFQKKDVVFGLGLGLLWTIEISINNFIRPGLPYRDIIDNTFLFIINLAILIVAARDAYQSNKFHFGVKSGFWTGLASGAIACLTALLLIVFGICSKVEVPKVFCLDI